ncbi:MAG TPA: DNA repair protein RadA [Candidatus Binatia bacterium]|nr:DNA repair protein RadA [Candidatus Binatia bacterium]
MPSGIAEFDRVLGGGIVSGSLVLVGGDPGIGKSTLLLQIAGTIADGRRHSKASATVGTVGSNEDGEKASFVGRAETRLRGVSTRGVGTGGVLYVSGEESAGQLKLRCGRLGLSGDGLFALPETSLDEAFRRAEALGPSVLVVDSIQTVHSQSAAQAPGSVAQLRQCAMELMRWAKESGVPVFIVGHVTKDGDIAGPRLLEHIVDVVLYLEGERFSSYRLLRGVKNRFGSVDDVGVFEMTAGGMREVANPSEAFIAERAGDAVGSAIVPTLEGSRPLLVEVQALTSPTVTPAPRRTANGLDVNRLVLVSAVLSRRLGIPLAAQDVIASVVGGLRVREPAADLALALAIASSHRDKPVPGDLVALGEIGLSGELRSVSQLERRLAEAERLGFKRCVLPQGSMRNGDKPKSKMALLPATTLREAIGLALG